MQTPAQEILIDTAYETDEDEFWGGDDTAGGRADWTLHPAVPGQVTVPPRIEINTAKLDMQAPAQEIMIDETLYETDEEEFWGNMTTTKTIPPTSTTSRRCS